MAKLRAVTKEVMADEIARDPAMKKVWDSYQAFFKSAKAYHEISEKEYYINR